MSAAPLFADQDTIPDGDVAGGRAHARRALGAQERLRGAVSSSFAADGPLAVLLFLYGQGDAGVSTAACCQASPGPRTTALRWITSLAEAGLVRQSPDPVDRRVTLLALTPRAEAAVGDWLRAMASPECGSRPQPRP